jgi:hypothetical protein
VQSDIPGRAASRFVYENGFACAHSIAHWDAVYRCRKPIIIQPDVWVDLDGDAVAESSLDGADDLVDI